MNFAQIILSAICFLLFASVGAFPAAAEETAAEVGKHAEASSDLGVISATGYELPEEGISSDVTVLTKEEIAALPVHNVAEALQYMPGVVVDKNGGPGNPAFISIHGSDVRHVRITIDGVPLNMLSEGFVDLSRMSVGHVERIEVLKGAASSVWGSSLSGVINIITKRPTDNLFIDVSTSYGEEDTANIDGVLSGTSGPFGYFLSAERFQTDGFFNNQDAVNHNAYGKLSVSVNSSTRADISVGIMDTVRGLNEYSFLVNPEDASQAYQQDDDTTEKIATLSLKHAVDADMDITASMWGRMFELKITENFMFQFPPDMEGESKEEAYGGTTLFVWRHSGTGTFSAGAEGGRGTLRDAETSSGEKKDIDSDTSAVYLNENYAIGNLTTNLGLRYDHDSLFGSETSPSIGLVYNVGNTGNLLRLNIGRGFTTPPLAAPTSGFDGNSDLTAERSWSYQAGMETSNQHPLAFKATIYRKDVTDAILPVIGLSCLPEDPEVCFPDLEKMDNIGKLRHQGVELEVYTREYAGLRLSYGYTHNDVRDLDVIVTGRARETHDVKVDYRGPMDIRANLSGHYVWWNSDQSFGSQFSASDRNFVWDAKISKYFTKWATAVGEVFVSVHNITDQEQNFMKIFPNPGRWLEGGISISF